MGVWRHSTLKNGFRTRSKLDFFKPSSYHQVVLSKFLAKVKPYFLRFRKYLPILIVLLALPITIIAGKQIQDLRNFASNTPSVLGFVAVNPGSLSTKVGDKDTAMSALAYDPAGRPIWSGVTYEWSMSSTNSVGTLGATSGNISSFQPLHMGYGDLHVIARMGSESVDKSISVVVADQNGVTPTPPTPVNNFGSALRVDSQSGHVMLTGTGTSLDSSYSNLTIEALINYHPYDGVIQYPIVSKSFTTGQKLPFLLKITPTGKLSFIYTVLSGNKWVNTEIVSNSTLEADKFYHVATVYDQLGRGGVITLFINGKIDAWIEQHGPIGGGSTGNIYIGVQNSSYFNGLIDEVRISDIPRYFGEIYSTTPHTNDGYTLGLYHFDNNLLDSSSNHRDGRASQVSYELSISSPFVFSPISPSPLPSPTPTPTPRTSPTLKPSPTCRPRPSCLDQTPRCAIPQTSDMCPPPTIRPLPTKISISPRPTTGIDKTITFYPQADSYVRNNYSSTNYGDRNVLWIDGSPIATAYLKLDITSLRTKTITKATLKLRVPDITDADSTGNFQIKVAGNSWSERGLNYSNRPGLGKTVGVFSKPKKGQTVSIDLTNWLGGFPASGIVSLGIDTQSADGAILRAREAGSKDNRPVLVVEYR